MGGLSAIGPALQIGGTVASAFGQRKQAKAAQAQAEAAARNEQVMAEFEAKQADYLAGQSIAISHREAYEQRRVAALVASKTLATAAASGAGASDPTVVDLVTEIYSEGAYRSLLALYEGEEQARSYTIAAQARRLGGQSAAQARIAEGQSIRKAGELSMFSTLLKGGSSMLDRYGGTGLFGGGGGGTTKQANESLFATYGPGPFASYKFG